MGNSVLKDTRKIFTSPGGDPTVSTRVTNLENNEYKITYYEVVSGTSGSLTVPSQATINPDEFGLSGDAILSKIDINNKPTYQSPTTSGGVVVTASLNTSTGAWVASGVYTDTSVALIYSIKIKAIYMSNLTYDNIIETVNLGGTGTASPLTTKGDLYTFNSTNARLPVGLDTQILIADSTQTTGLKWGSNTAATPTGYYGAFEDNTIQTAVAINTPYAMKFGITDLSNGVTIVSDGSNLTRVTIANTGIYNIQFSAQFDRTNSGTDSVDIWLRKNGVDVPGSGGKIVLSGSATASQIIATWNYVLNVVGGDYYQLMWSTPDTHVRLLYEAAQTSPFAHPIIPSVILTVTQQSGIMAGTGLTAINSLTGAAQTLTTGTTGTDFAISSSGSTHTFNLPTASATNRGALSSTDWSTFNGKQNALGFTPVTNARTITINGTTYDLTADRTWTISTTANTSINLFNYYNFI